MYSSGSLCCIQVNTGFTSKYNKRNDTKLILLTLRDRTKRRNTRDKRYQR